MTEEDIKNVMYGSIRELMRERKYYYSGYHSHFTEEGRAVISEMVDMYSQKIEQAVKTDDEQRAKQMVFDTLKGETK